MKGRQVDREEDRQVDGQKADKTRRQQTDMQTCIPYLESGKVSGKKVIGRAAAPIHNMLVLTAAAQLTVPVGDTKIGLHKCFTHGAIANHSVEE